MKEIVKHAFLLPRADKYKKDQFTDDEIRAISCELTENEKKIRMQDIWIFCRPH